jgi:myosin-crossreactive antigen
VEYSVRAGQTAAFTLGNINKEPNPFQHASRDLRITSQFMPRHIADRPQVIPNGCVNLAFIGQYVETPGDVSFTVERSVRTAMMAVWGLTGLQKPQVPMYEPVFDVRVIAKSLKMAVGSDTLNLGVLDKVKSATGGAIAKKLDAGLAHVPDPAWF